MVDDHRAGAGIGELDLAAAPVLAQLQHRAQMFVGHKNRRPDPWLFDERDRVTGSGMSAGLCSSFIAAVGHVDAINHRRRRGDQFEIEFALEPLADDLEMQQPEKPAAETETQRGRTFRLIGKARIVQMQPARAPRADRRTAPHRPETARRTPPAAPA